jgi:hypothetical protein
MTTARRLALVLVVYLAADFVDASAPGVFFFDSALFLGTVVQSKVRSADAGDQARDAGRAVAEAALTVANDDRLVPRLSLPPARITTRAPVARSATSKTDPGATATDH